MNTSSLFKKLWIVSLAIILPQICFGYCPDTDKVGWIFSDAILCWNTYEQGLGFTNKHSDVLITDDFTERDVLEPTFKWELGFRLGVGYTQCDRQWSYQAYWTYLESKAHGKKFHNSGPPDFEGSFPIWSMSPDTLSSDYISAASSEWHLHTNIIDFNLQYNYACLCDLMTLMPFAGLRAVCLSQELTARYEGGTFFSGVDENVLRSRYWGGGVRLGLNADYYLVCGMSVFGRVAVAPLFGGFHLKERETYLEAVRFEETTNKYHFLLSTDCELGLRWKGLLIPGWPYIVISFAVEGQQFFWANQFRRGPFDFFSKERGLFLQGVTLNASLDF